MRLISLLFPRIFSKRCLFQYMRKFFPFSWVKTTQIYCSEKIYQRSTAHHLHIKQKAHPSWVKPNKKMLFEKLPPSKIASSHKTTIKQNLFSHKPPSVQASFCRKPTLPHNKTEYLLNQVIYYTKHIYRGKP